MEREESTKKPKIECLGFFYIVKQLFSNKKIQIISHNVHYVNFRKTNIITELHIYEKLRMTSPIPSRN